VPSYPEGEGRAMRFPKRIATHITETASWRLLQSAAPTEWIVREVSERDYGVDCYIEIASKDGDITGELVSAQLKGVEKLDWKGKKTERTARSPSVKSATATYWLNLPVPVFLLVADLSVSKVHYVGVKQVIRAQFDALGSQDTITFPLQEELHLQSDVGKALFDWFAHKERHYEQFSFHVMNLLSHVRTFVDFIRMNQNRTASWRSNLTDIFSSGPCMRCVTPYPSFLNLSGNWNPWPNSTGWIRKNGKTNMSGCTKRRSITRCRSSKLSFLGWFARRSRS
jgi:hypothetical protein